MDDYSRARAFLRAEKNSNWYTFEMTEIYHGTTQRGLGSIKPFKRFTPGGQGLSGGIPPRIYATYVPAFAVAHSFPWSSDDGIDILVEGNTITLVVPKNKQVLLEQGVCIYTLPDSSFNFTEEEETGLTYHSAEAVQPSNCQCFSNVKAAMQYFSGKIKIM